MKEQINILITGAGSVMGQSIYRALQHANHPMQVIMTNAHDLGAALYFNQKNYYPPIQKTVIVPYASEPKYQDFIHELVVAESIDLVFSGTQHEIAALSAYGEKNPIVAALRPAILNLALDKKETAEFFGRHQIKAPKTWVLSELLAAISSPFIPLIIKPRSSSSSRHIYAIKTEAELLAFLKEHPEFQQEEMIAQEFIDGKEYTCGCYIDRYSKKISTIVFERELAADGATLYGEVIHNQEIESYLQSIAKALIAEGMAFGHVNVQLRLRNGQPYCFEINGRLSSTESPKAFLGFNSVNAYIYNIVLQEPYDQFQVQFGKKFLRYYEEVYF